MVKFSLPFKEIFFSVVFGATSDLAKNYVLTNAAGKEGISFDKDVKKAYNKSSSTVSTSSISEAHVD